jgi:hypothetical protein
MNGDSRANRQQFLDILVEAGTGGIEDHPQRLGFLEGSEDIPLSEIAIDSLALMEVAIAIEETLGVSLAPDQIMNNSSLGDLWLAVVDQADRD